MVQTKEIHTNLGKQLELEVLVKSLYLLASDSYSEQSVKGTTRILIRAPNIPKLKGYREAVKHLLEKEGHQTASDELNSVAGFSLTQSYDNFSPVHYRGIIDRIRIGKDRVTFYIHDEKLPLAEKYVSIMDKIIELVL